MKSTVHLTDGNLLKGIVKELALQQRAQWQPEVENERRCFGFVVKLGGSSLNYLPGSHTSHSVQGLISAITSLMEAAATLTETGTYGLPVPTSEKRRNVRPH